MNNLSRNNSRNISDGVFSLNPASEIAAYEVQLQLVNDTLSFLEHCGDPPATHEHTRTELISLRSSIQEMIALTAMSEGMADTADFLRSLDEDSPNECSLREDTDGNLEEELDVQKALSAILGCKCQAPYVDATSIHKTYYNALVVSAVPPTEEIRSVQELKVKVLFSNPISKAMVPCPFYLDGKCRYEDDKCHYSHGEVVPYSDLKEYREPNFEQVKPMSVVLAKQADGIWYRALVEEVTDQNEVIVKLESGGGKRDKVLLQDVLLLGDIKVSSNSGAGSSSYLNDGEEQELRKSLMAEKSLLSNPTRRMLGEWEKYTNSIGSRMMMNMGYVTGTGLGKHSDGLVEPIPAVICPPGKSLDYCMNMRENANPFFYRVNNVQESAPFDKGKIKPQAWKNGGRHSDDVFSFMNSVFQQHGNNVKKSDRKSSESFKASTSQQLNVEGLKVSEDIRKKERDINTLKRSLSKSSDRSTSHDVVKKKLSTAQNELLALQQRERDITKEQHCRETKKKMTEF